MKGYWSKQETAELRSRARTLLEEYGATQTDETSWDEYLVQTPLGPWHVYVFEDWIATRFEDVSRAKSRVGCNPYSGKWNFYALNDDLSEFLSDFESQTRRMMQIRP